jgi:hypothetical protein
MAKESQFRWAAINGSPAEHNWREVKRQNTEEWTNCVNHREPNIGEGRPGDRRVFSHAVGADIPGSGPREIDCVGPVHASGLRATGVGLMALVG